MGNIVVMLGEVGTGAGALDTAFSGIKTDVLAALTTVAPYGVAIVGAFLVWKYGIKFFKGLAK